MNEQECQHVNAQCWNVGAFETLWICWDCRAYAWADEEWSAPGLIEELESPGETIIIEGVKSDGRDLGGTPMEWLPVEIINQRWCLRRPW